VAIAEAGLTNVPLAAAPATVDTGCRDDLVAVNGQPFPVAVRGARTSARTGLDLVACDTTLPLPEGSNGLTTSPGRTTGIDVDRVVLSSDRAGGPAPITPAGAPARASGASVKVTSSSEDSYHLKVRTDGAPFWLVLGQSQSDGWEATVNGKSLGTSHLVNGFANGWTVRPGEAGTVDVVLRWTPQRAVWIGLAVSGLAVLACLVLIVGRGRRPAGGDTNLVDSPVATSPMSFPVVSPSLGATVAAAIGAGVVTAVVSRWWIGVVVAVATFVAPRLSRGRLLLAAGSPIALAFGALFDIPELGWVAVGLLIGDLVAGALWARRRSSD
jgi:arabinofuranan 3-O-arabinosyltransferase